MATEQAEHPFEAFFRTYPGAFVIVSPGGEVIAMNAAARALAGEKLAPGVRVAEHAHPDDALALTQALGLVKDDGAPARFMCRARQPNGGMLALAWQIWRAPGRPEIFATLSLADSAHAHVREAETAPEKPLSERVLRALLDHLDIIAWVTDKDGIYTFYDGKALAAFGASPGQLLGQSVFDVFGDHISPPMRAALDGTPGRESVHIVGSHWDNVYLPIHDAGNGFAGVIGISQNMNEGQRIREELEARLALIERQEAVIRDLETPIIQVWENVLTLPMIGVVDSRRAARVMDDLLGAVSRASARFAILDLTGVEVVDTATAYHLVQMVHAIRLLGAEGILTGIRPTVAQTLISLGVDLSGIPTHGTLRHGLAFCIRRLETRTRRPAL
ncbi:STAS domain-containing protein [Polyangium sorediatum]|uniref:PAS domain-containing protein n=1 Tax=Polyangium sorediatum TaxID=889274 RepID=A0ABT6P5H0_9BACT|nr:STAS domain-containing protein [Polyangium sorediatum]MDI1435853.1 PAS domain-containing protein [Polyangium sorediatum]